MLRRLVHQSLKLLPATVYLPVFFKRKHGTKLDLRNPRTFNHKLQWLKCHARDSRMTRLADKWAVREFVAETVGQQYLNDAVGVFDSTAEISIDALPNRFVIKATHGSGWNSICRDKAAYDWPTERRKLDTWLTWNHYWPGREWAYKNIPPRLMIEHYLAGPTGDPPADYKFFCFSGVPRAIQVDMHRFTRHTQAMFDPSWQRLPFSLKYPAHPGDIPRPPALDEMLNIAARLSAGFPFVRVDLYDLAGRVVFGEMTFYPESGVGRFDPPDYDRQFGDWIQLPVQHA